MSCSNIAKHKKIIASITVVMMLFAMFFSAFYIAGEVGHHCDHEDCPICACIHQCENLLNQTYDGVAILIAMILPIIFCLTSNSYNSIVLVQKTPVSSKVRLDS